MYLHMGNLFTVAFCRDDTPNHMMHVWNKNIPRVAQKMPWNYMKASSTCSSPTMHLVFPGLLMANSVGLIPGLKKNWFTKPRQVKPGSNLDSCSRGQLASIFTRLPSENGANLGLIAVGVNQGLKFTVTTESHLYYSVKRVQVILSIWLCVLLQ